MNHCSKLIRVSCLNFPTSSFKLTQYKSTPFIQRRNNYNFSMALNKGPGLDRIVKLDLLQNETPKKITSIWVQYHHKKPCISAVIPTEQYQNIKKKAERCPMFVFPIPKEKGFLSIFCQMLAKNDKVIFTTLEEYQKKLGGAPAYLQVSYYTELQESKGIVLMRGDVDTSVITTQEAQLLANLWQIYLLDDDKYKLLETFNHEPTKFDYNLVLKDIEATVHNLNKEEKQANVSELD